MSNLFRMRTLRLPGWSPRKEHGPEEEEEEAALAAAAAALAAKEALLQQQTTTPPKLNISWCEEVLVYDIPHLADFTSSDIEALWWSRDDFSRFREMYHIYASMGFPEDIDVHAEEAADCHRIQPDPEQEAEDLEQQLRHGDEYSYDVCCSNDHLMYGDINGGSGSYLYCEDQHGNAYYHHHGGDSDTEYPTSGSESPSDDEDYDDGTVHGGTVHGGDGVGRGSAGAGGVTGGVTGGDDPPSSEHHDVQGLFDFMTGHENGRVVQPVPFGVPRFRHGAGAQQVGKLGRYGAAPRGCGGGGKDDYGAATREEPMPIFY